MTTIQTFIKQHELTCTSEHTFDNPELDDEPHHKSHMDHWIVTISRGDNATTHTVNFSQGSGWGGAEPKLEDVLDCLASDATGIENSGSFEDWAAEYGYDEDSRSAERTYHSCQDQSEKLKAFLDGLASTNDPTETAYHELLFNTERL